MVLSSSEAVRPEGAPSQFETKPDIAVFASFRLHRGERRLEQNGERVAIGSRALDILAVLLDRPGEVVTRRELLDAVWPDLLVEESNLRVHVANLRKLLGDGEPTRLIANIPGRGYSFVAPVRWLTAAQVAAKNATTDARIDNDRAEVGLQRPTLPVLGALPRRLTRIVGREELIEELVEQASHRRFLSIIGPGGIGKTTVALAAARGVASTFRDGVTFVDLGPIRQPSFVTKSLAAALGVAVDPENGLLQLVETLGKKEMLIVLDCCEHVVEAAAEVATGLLYHCEDIRILVTSREALRAEGEWVLRLPPLALPDDTLSLTAAEAMRSAAVQLFVERADDSLGGYILSDADAPLVAEICTKLDGIALAIELAAGRIATISLLDLRGQLEDRLLALRYGRRTALPRHQTLTAALDWSYDLLSEKERWLLGRLSVLHGLFSVEAAVNVCSCEIILAAHIEDILLDLVAKSLISAHPADEGTFYRLLDTTRSYARRKLEERGDTETYFHRHARYFCEVFRTGAVLWEATPTTIWIERYVPKIDDLRAALNWTFSRRGDVNTGITLVLAAVPLWAQLSLVDEFLQWIGRALAEAELAGERSKGMHMQLYAALGGLQMYAISTTQHARSSLEKALEIAVELGNSEYTLRGLRALWAEAVNSGELRRSMDIAERFRNFAAEIENGPAQIVADRLIGTSLHYLGNQPAASHALERMIDRYSEAFSHSDIVRYQFDQRLTARMINAKALWLRGRTETAKREVEAIVGEGISLGHTMSFCNILSQCACPIALFERDERAARHYLALLKEWTAPRALDVWRVFTECYEAEVEIEFGDVDFGLDRLRRTEDRLEHSFKHHRTSFLVATTQGLYSRGDFEEARRAVAKAMQISTHSGEGWRLPELYRWLGKIALASGENEGSIETAFRNASRTAAEQGALSFELRAAISLAEWRTERAKPNDALATLSQVCARFSEGFDNPDLKRAEAMLEAAGYHRPRNDVAAENRNLT